MVSPLARPLLVQRTDIHAPVGFEPTISMPERAKIFQASDERPLRSAFFLLVCKPARGGQSADGRESEHIPEMSYTEASTSWGEG